MRNSYQTLKLVCCITGIICFTHKTNAQNWKTSGNSVSSGDFIGSTNNKALIFETNDTLRMKIDANGDIKMKGKLVVDSIANFKGPVSFNGPSGDAIIPEPGISPFGYPTQDDHWFTTNYYSIMGAHVQIFPLPVHYVANALNAFGVSTQNPLYMLDVLCTSGVSKSDINVSTTATTQNVGYRIGGNYVLWHNGNVNNLYVGVGAGNSTSTGTNNTFWGYGAGNVNSAGFDNTFGGTRAGISNTSGDSNTFVGYNAGNANTTAIGSTIFGCQAGNSNNANYNTIVGYQAGYSNTAGWGNTFVGYLAGKQSNGGAYHSWNTYVGYLAGEQTTIGQANSFFGKHAGTGNTTGSLNTYLGAHAGDGSLAGNDNVGVGTYNLANNKYGNDNVFAGNFSGYNTGVSAADDSDVAIGSNSGYNQRGTYNTFLGAAADEPSSSSLTNASAIGARASVTSNNSMILGGNNDVTSSHTYATYLGIGFEASSAAPANSLEINARNQTTGAVVPFTSGLRFTQLTSAATPATNPGTGVLAVNANGDVIYVNASGGGSSVTANNGTSINPANNVQLGQTSGAGGSPGELLHYTEIPMNDFNLAFTDAGATPGGGDITIGPALGFSAKLGINNIAEQSGLEILNNTSLGGQYGAYIIASGSSSTSTGTYSLSNCTGNSNYGIFAIAENGSSYNYGSYFASSGSGTNNFGMYATASGGTNNYAGWFDGNVNVNGTLTVYGSPVLTSDIMFKTNIDSITNALAIIKQLKPKEFNFDTTNIYGIHFPSQKQYGFIAQDVQPILPELVITSHRPEVRDSAGVVIDAAVDYKSLNYNAFFAILMKGVQEQERTIENDSLTTTKQQLTIDSLRTVLNSIQSCINRLCDSTSHSAIQPNIGSNSDNTTDITLSNSAILYQNTPNPFGVNGTKINYFLPQNTTDAIIVFSDMYGSELKSVSLTQTGMGTINVNPDRLSNGIYSYSLVINGQVIDTKKMVVSQ